MQKNFTIIGCGIAGFTAAKTLRELMPDAEVVIIDSGTHGLYSRIRLPDVLAGKLPEEKLVLTPPEAIRALGIHLIDGVGVESVQSAGKTLTLTDHRILSYGTLIFATGAEAALPPIKGASPDMTLRSMEDLERCLKQLLEAKSAIVIGGGLLGLEAAHALLQRNLSVTIVEFMPRLLPRQLSEKESALLLQKFEESGYCVLTGRTTVSLEQNGSRWCVHLDDGTAPEGDIVLISAGIRPRTALAVSAGVAVDRGIVVNDKFETSLQGVYAIGDCAQLNGTVYGLWAASKDQGTALAEILAGTRETFISPVYEPSLKIPGIKLKEIRMAVQA